MPALQLTDIGWEAVMRRSRTGPRIGITAFAVAEHAVDYTPSQGQTTLNGTVLYRGALTSVKRNKNLDLVFCCDIPSSSVLGDIYEIGLYLDTGELFAVGVFDDRYSKSDPTKVFQLRIYCYLRLPTDNASVEFECVEQPIVPVFPTFASLPPANIAGPNVAVVLDGHCGGSSGFVTSPVTVCKWRNADEWAIVSGSIIYEGPASCDVAGSTVTLTDPDVSRAQGHSGKDIAMLVVTHGNGRYQTRRVNYTGGAVFTITDKPLRLAFDHTTRVAIWAGPGCCAGAC